MIKTIEVQIADIDGIPVSIRFQVPQAATERAVQEAKVEKVVSVVEEGLKLYAMKKKARLHQMPDGLQAPPEKRLIVPRSV